MSSQIIELLYFYRSQIGKIAFAILLDKIQNIWTKPPEKLCGIGYTDHILDFYHTQSTRCMALTPSFLGVYARSGFENYPTIIIDETQLPISQESQTHILCMHILEHTVSQERFLHSVYHSLKPEGEVIFIVSNRRGNWARNENTPFGSGRPYTRKQLTSLITQAGFIITDFVPALFISPEASRFLQYNSDILEMFGQIFLSRYSGLHIVRAIKRIYVAPMNRVRQDTFDVIKDMLPIPNPITRFC